MRVRSGLGGISSLGHFAAQKIITYEVLHRVGSGCSTMPPGDGSYRGLASTRRADID